MHVIRRVVIKQRQHAGACMQHMQEQVCNTCRSRIHTHVFQSLTRYIWWFIFIGRYLVFIQGVCTCTPILEYMDDFSFNLNWIAKIRWFTLGSPAPSKTLNTIAFKSYLIVVKLYNVPTKSIIYFKHSARVYGAAGLVVQRTTYVSMYSFLPVDSACRKRVFRILHTLYGEFTNSAQ